MRHVTFVALFAILSASSCVRTHDAPAESRDTIAGGIELAIVEEAPRGAIGTLEHHGRRYVMTSPAWHARLSSMQEAIDELGFDAIAFKIAPADSKKFSDWTESNTDKAMAILVRDELLCVATILSRLPGQGTISDRFDSARVEELMARIAANR